MDKNTQPSTRDSNPRYDRQARFHPIGNHGQRRLRAARITIIGSGALGTVLADILVRAGIGYLRLVDRDFVELSNLQRQVLFDEQDVADQLPKAIAATRKLRRINSDVHIDPVVAHADPTNIATLCNDAQLILDGTDNLQTRYLINDVCVKHDLPWIYGACLAAEGRLLPIIPHKTPCLRCLWDTPPHPGSTPTCESAGILATTVHLVAAFQATEALKILLGLHDQLNTRLRTIDAWTGRFHDTNVDQAADAGSCPCCHQHRFEFLEGTPRIDAETLCGRNAVQVLPATTTRLDLARLAASLPTELNPSANAHMLRFTSPPHTITVFPDGRAIIQNTDNPTTARTIYDKYVGS